MITTKNAKIIFTVGCIICYVLGFLTSKSICDKPIQLPKVNPLIELYKDSINDMRKQAKLDTKINNLNAEVETLYIYSKIKQNEQKTDTTNSLVLIRFDRLLSINRANQRGKLVPSAKH